MPNGLVWNTASDQVSASSSWLATLLGVLPFALLGPVNVLLAYPYPSSAWWSSEGFASIRLVFVSLIMLLGLVLGWAKGWPRWAFPYLGLWLVVAGASLAGWINTLVFPRGPEWPPEPQILIAITTYALVIAGLVLLARFLPLLHSLYRQVREDWTRLSFGLFLGAAIIFGMIEHEEDPRLTLPVFLPSVLVFLCALAHLRLAGKVPKVAAMLLGVILPVAVRVATAKPGYLGFGLVVMVVVMLPIFLELLPRPKAVASS